MGTEAALKAVHDLEGFFGTALTEEQKAFWGRKLYWAHPKDLEDGIDQIKTKSAKGRFPTLEDVLRECDIARVRRTAIEARRVDEQARVAMEPSRLKTEFARDCAGLIREICSREPSLETAKWKLAEAQKLQKKYPETDFRDVIKSFYDDLGKYEQT